MAAQDIAAALQRVESALRRRPEFGLNDDEPATARWDGGLRMHIDDGAGTQVVTDMPGEFGGGGGHVGPTWLFRAGLASCAATRIAMAAAAEGIELKTLELRASSRSDARGVFGIPDEDGGRVSAGPREVELLVRIGAPGVTPERLQALVEGACGCSPVSCTVREALPLALRVEANAG